MVTYRDEFLLGNRTVEGIYWIARVVENTLIPLKLLCYYASSDANAIYLKPVQRIKMKTASVWDT